jgi:[ribosomal protein S18]-alanine N-acetyltransferase
MMRIVALTPGFARDICTWQYPAPYDCYDMTGVNPEDLLRHDSGFFALLRDGELAGFRSFGVDGRVPGWEYDDTALDTGGGLRPDLVGRGLGREAIATGLAFGRSRFAPPAFRVTVAAFNTRALRTVESLGFSRVGSFDAAASDAAASDVRTFQVLVRPESLSQPAG